MKRIFLIVAILLLTVGICQAAPNATNILPLGTSTWMNLEVNPYTGPVYGKAVGAAAVTVYYWQTIRE